MAIPITLASCASEPELVGTVDTTGETRPAHIEITNASDECIEMRLFFDEALLIEGTVAERGSAHCFSVRVISLELPVGDHAVFVEAEVPSTVLPVTVSVEAETFIGVAFSDSLVLVTQEPTSTLPRCR